MPKGRGRHKWVSRYVQGQSTVLLSLPTEILQGIAGFCPWSTVISLQLTCRRLRALCHDKFVFEEVAKSQYIYEGVSQKTWNHPTGFFDGLSPVEASKIACAVEKACKGKQMGMRLKMKPRLPFTSLTSVERWLPHLVALRHPAAFQIDAADVLQLLINGSESGNSLCNLEHSLLGRIMSTEENESEVIRGVMRSVLKGEKGRDEVENYAFSRLLFFGPLDNVFVYGTRYIMRWVPMGVIICVYWGLSQKPLRYCPVPFPQPRLIFDPLPFKLPPMFRSYEDDDKGTGFSNSHLEVMTSAEFLSTGSWLGVYTYTTQDDQEEIFGLYDAPMKEIHFECETVDQIDIRTKVKDSSRGSDGIGDFTISGDIHGDGKVYLQKAYIGTGVTWLWTGEVTAYGLAGAWGRDRDRYGFFWIWKLDWCDPNSDTRYLPQNA